MYALDFFNTSPQYSIFQKETNKTTFGGIIFLLFLIGMFILSLAYIYSIMQLMINMKLNFMKLMPLTQYQQFILSK